jgi:hypothetical protein
MSEDNAKPKLDAATLPIGTVMVLGGDTYEKRSDGDRGYSWVRSSDKDGLLSWCSLSYLAVQELIDRGVEFRLPEGGAK